MHNRSPHTAFARKSKPFICHHIYNPPGLYITPDTNAFLEVSERYRRKGHMCGDLPGDHTVVNTLLSSPGFIFIFSGRCAWVIQGLLLILQTNSIYECSSVLLFCTLLLRTSHTRRQSSVENDCWKTGKGNLLIVMCIKLLLAICLFFLNHGMCFAESLPGFHLKMLHHVLDKLQVHNKLHKETFSICHRKCGQSPYPLIFHR